MQKVGRMNSVKEVLRTSSARLKAARDVILRNSGGERLCCKNDLIGEPEQLASLFGIDDSAFQSEGYPDELNLANDILFWQPPHLAFPDHVQNLVPLNRAPRSIERSKTLASIHPPLDRSMILFHNSI